jgi:hypothetical protein
MGQFKPMVKMETTEPSVELKLKKGGSVKSPKKMMNGGVMGALAQAPAPGARGGMAPAARPGKPSMMDRRKAMMGKPAMAQPMMAEGGESKAVHKAETAKMKGLEKELKSHASKPASKGHQGLKTGGIPKSTKPGAYATGGVVNGQGGYKAGGIIKSEKGETMMRTAKPNHNSAPTGEVKLGNAGGYKKGGATKKHYATGGAVNDSGHAVAMPAKAASKPVSNDRQSGTFKTGGSVTPAQKKEQSYFKAENATAMKQAKAYSNEKYGRKMQSGGTTSDKEQRMLDKAYEDSIGPSKEDLDMAKELRSIPRKMYEGAKSLFTAKEKPAGSVTKTEKSVTVAPAKKRGGSVKC